MKNRKSRVSQKISKLIIVAGIASLSFIILIAVIFIGPTLKKNAVAACNANMKLIALQTKRKIDLIDSYASSMADRYGLKTALHQLQQSPFSGEKLETVIRELDDKQNQMDGVLVIAVQPPDRSIITTTHALSLDERMLFDSPEYLHFKTLDYGKKIFYVYEVTYSADHAWGNDPQTRYAVAYCMNFYVNEQRYTITLFVEINDILDATESLAENTMDSYMWIDASKTPFFQHGDAHLNQLVQKALSDRLIYTYDTIQVKDGVLFMHTLSQSKWTLCAYLSELTIWRTYGNTLLISVALFVMLVLIMTVLILPLTNHIMRPLQELNRSMQTVGTGDLSVRTNIQTNDELGDLSVGFNRMIVDINTYVNQLLEKEKVAQRMKYSLLISEIDPHFIYNTMNSINYLARKGRDVDIVKVNSALISILQDRLRINSIEVFDTVEQECNMIRQYMIIQEFRYNNEVDVRFEIEEALLKEQMPKNILQPLVENALLHGLTNEAGESIPGIIEIQIYKEVQTMAICVLNTGSSIAHEQAEKINSGSVDTSHRGRHIGIQNILERLQYLYGENAAFYIRERDGGGTSVTIHLPFTF